MLCRAMRPLNVRGHYVRLAVLASEELVSFTVPDELHLRRIELQISIYPIRDIAEVAQSGGEERLLDLCVQEFRISGAYRLSEVLEVTNVCRIFHLRLQFLVTTHADAEPPVRHHVHVALGAVEIP